MKPLHEELKTIRLEKKISLKDISAKMRIRLDYLESIEEGDYTVTPLPFLRAFLREYAEVVEINPELVMMKFDNKIDSILSSDAVEEIAEDKSAPQKRISTDVKIIKPEESSSEDKNSETESDERPIPKKRKRRKKTNGETKSKARKPRKTKAEKETPDESEQEKKETVKTDAQISLFNGDSADAQSEEPAPESSEVTPAEDETPLAEDIQPQEETPAEEISSPAETVKFKQIVISEEPRREPSRNIDSLISDEQKSSNIQFYGVLVIMIITIALIIYLVSSGIIF